MIELTFNATDVLLLNDVPTFRREYSAEFDSPTDLQRSLNNIETRRPYAATTRVGVKQTIVFSGASLRSAQLLFRGLKAQPVLLPFWPAVAFWSTRAASPIKGGLMLAYKPDWSQYSVYEYGSEPLWPSATDLVVPVLWGFIKKTDFTFLNVDTAILPVDFTEASQASYALTFTTSAFTAGPSIAGYASAPTLIPIKPDYRQMSDSLVVSVERKVTGFAREQTPTYYGEDPWRTQNGSFTVSGAANISQFVGWFAGTSSQGASFWAASSEAIGYLGANATSGATALTWTDANVEAGDYVCTFKPDGSLIFAQIQSVVGTTITLVAAFGYALPKGQPFYALNLVRQDKPKLSVRWLSPTLAKFTLSWSEARPEYSIPSGETLGVTIGQLPTRVILFQFIRDYGNGTVVNSYFTNYEKDLTYNTHTWSHVEMNVGAIKQSTNLETDKIQIDSISFAGNPVIQEILLQNQNVLSVKIIFADYVGGVVVNVNTVFQGVLAESRRVGKKTTTTFTPGPFSLDALIPRLLRATTCAHLGGTNNDGSFLISFGCTLLKTDWKFSGTVANPVSGAWPYELNLTGVAGVGANAIAAITASGVFSDYFAYGWVEFGTGSNIQRVGIILSTAYAAGAVTLTLDRWFLTSPVAGNTVSFFPGCDGQYKTCKAFDSVTNPLGKFGNDLNFGGLPNMPLGNPTILQVGSSPAQGSKKG